MENIEVFLRGLLVGIIVSAPMGPIGVLCVQKTVNKGRAVGFLSGLGAATADSIYAFLTAFGVTFITNFLHEKQMLMQVVGIGVLLFLGIRMIMSNPIKQYRYRSTSSSAIGGIKDFFSVFFLTLSNPLTILFFGAAFAMIGLIDVASPNQNSFLVSGVFLGASVWWFIVASIVNLFRKKFRLRNIFILNRVSGSIIVILSIAAAVKFFLL